MCLWGEMRWAGAELLLGTLAWRRVRNTALCPGSTRWSGDWGGSQVCVKAVRVSDKFPLAESLSQYCKSLTCEITNWFNHCETMLIKANFNGEYQGSFKIHTSITNLRVLFFSVMFFLSSWLVGVNHRPRTTYCLFLFHNWLICQRAVNVGLIHFDREIEICIRPYRLWQHPSPLFPYWQAVKG